MGFLDKVKNLVSQNADKVDTAIDKVGDVVDKKTQGKYTQHVDKVQEAAKKAVDSTQAGTQQPGPVPPTQQSGQPPASPPAPPQAPTPPQS